MFINPSPHRQSESTDVQVCNFHLHNLYFFLMERNGTACTDAHIMVSQVAERLTETVFCDENLFVSVSSGQDSYQ